MHVPEAMDAVMEVGFFRHTVLVPCWKLTRRVGIGSEGNLAEAQHGSLRRCWKEHGDGSRPARVHPHVSSLRGQANPLPR
jgi:hypothetical protein